MSVKLLNEHHLEFLSLTGGCTGSFGSTLVKMPRCWKSRVTAQLCTKYCNPPNIKSLLTYLDGGMKYPLYTPYNRLFEEVLPF